MTTTVLIMAGGTGGHVYPAIAVAEYLRERGYGVRWLGTDKGLEARVVPAKGFPIDFITSAGVRGKGLLQKLQAPFAMARGLWEALRVMQREQPVAVLGMGGFVSVPGGVASFLLGKPLVIHEQNAVAGTANRFLARFAHTRLQGFDGALRNGHTVGNPVRRDIAALHSEVATAQPSSLHLLVLGGSLGAKALNDVLPEFLRELPPGLSLQVWHQTGPGTHDATLAEYQRRGISVDGETLRVTPYIEDMAGAYRWADVMLCRAGAMTLAELTCAGLPAVLVPLPNAIDDHQRKNAEALAHHGAAIVLPQAQLSAETLRQQLLPLLQDSARRAAMARASRQLAPVRATHEVATYCLAAGGITLSGASHG